MQNESQNIEYKESWGRGFKKIAEEFERASFPLPTIEENGGGVMAIIQRKTIDEVIAERGEDVGKCRCKFKRNIRCETNRATDYYGVCY